MWTVPVDILTASSDLPQNLVQNAAQLLDDSYNDVSMIRASSNVCMVQYLQSPNCVDLHLATHNGSLSGVDGITAAMSVHVRTMINRSISKQVPSLSTMLSAPLPELQRWVCRVMPSPVRPDL